MSDLAEPMIHEDALPGHESQLDPKPDWAPRFPGSDRLKGKVALITGADSGIGRAVAALFAREGADVAIVYLCEHDDAAATKRMIEKEGRRALTIAGDIGDPATAQRVISEGVARFGRIDTLVNNAGVASPSPIEEITPESIECLRRNLAAEIAAGVGGQVAGHDMQFPGRAGSLERRPEASEEQLAQIPLRRWGTPEEFGDVVCFLASDRARYVSGQAIVRPMRPPSRQMQAASMSSVPRPMRAKSRTHHTNSASPAAKARETATKQAARVFGFMNASSFLNTHTVQSPCAIGPGSRSTGKRRARP